MHVLVTGGAGLLGREIVAQLLGQGHQVRVMDLNPLPDPQVEKVTGSILDAALVSKACQGVDAVIHTASVVSQQLGQPQHVYDVNVVGTQTLIAACQAQSVPKLIYTSSIDVVFDGSPIVNGDEHLPYAAKHLDYYGTTKTIAEKAVVAANGQQGLTTGVLRSAGLYGPGDRHRFPAVLKPVLGGQFVRIGSGAAQFKHVFVGNMAHAHLLLMNALGPDAVCAGQVYFVTDYEPSNFFDFFLPYLDALNMDYRVQTIPKGVAYTIANLLEWRYAMMRQARFSRVLLTRYAVAAVAEDFWFNHNKATRDFGYQPIYTAEEAFQRTLAWLREDWLPSQNNTK